MGTMMLLSKEEMFQKGLELFCYEDNGYINHASAEMTKTYSAVFGSDAATLANVWADLQTTNIAEARIENASEKDLKYFLACHHWLKSYATWMAMAVKFKKSGLGTRETISKRVWAMVRCIRALKVTKIKWPERFDRDDTETHIYSVDGKHCRCHEQMHPEFSKDSSWYSHKSGGPGVAYEVALDIWNCSIVHVSQGIRKASKHDKTIYTEDGGLRSKTREGKKGIADKSYKAKKKEAPLPINIASSHNTERVRKFESRVKPRQESFFGRMANFGVISGDWRHEIELHCLAFEAVCVILQYQFENGHPLFDV